MAAVPSRRTLTQNRRPFAAHASPTEPGQDRTDTSTVIDLDGPGEEDDEDNHKQESA
jgi:hypothetical protein